MHEEVRPPQPRGDVRNTAGKIERHVELTRESTELRALWPLAEDDEMRSPDVAQRAHGVVDPLLRFEPADRQQNPRVRRHWIGWICSPRGRHVVEAVVDHLDLLLRQPDALDLEAGERLRDHDDPGGSTGERTLDEAKRPCAKGVVVVLRRNQPLRTECAVHVGVHEVRVHDVGAPHGAPHAQGQQRVEVARR